MISPTTASDPDARRPEGAEDADDGKPGLHQDDAVAGRGRHADRHRSADHVAAAERGGREENAPSTVNTLGIADVQKFMSTDEHVFSAMLTICPTTPSTSSHPISSRSWWMPRSSWATSTMPRKRSTRPRTSRPSARKGWTSTSPPRPKRRRSRRSRSRCRLHPPTGRP